MLCLSAQQALEEAFKENAIAQRQARELHAHTFDSYNAADDRVRLHAAPGYFEYEYQLRAQAWGIVCGNKQAAHPYCANARNFLLATAVPGHKHALGQGDSSVSALNENCFLGHAARNPIRPLEFQAPKVKGRFLKLQAKFPTAPICLPGPNDDNFAGILVGQINQPEALFGGKAL